MNKRTPPPTYDARDRASSRALVFVEVVALEAAIIVALWFLGRFFS